MEGGVSEPIPISIHVVVFCNFEEALVQEERCSIGPTIIRAGRACTRVWREVRHRVIIGREIWIGTTPRDLYSEIGEVTFDDIDGFRRRGGTRERTVSLVMIMIQGTDCIFGKECI